MRYSDDNDNNNLVVKRRNQICKIWYVKLQIIYVLDETKVKSKVTIEEIESKSCCASEVIDTEKELALIK